MADMGKIVGAVIAIAVSVIVIATVLAPTIADYTITGGALEDYAGLLGAVVIMSIVGVLMVAVRLIGSGRN
ncbi:hypothetical protein [Methanothrix soehngenii]|uniref:hypothetical protein n=1 Tax=Methanothrix soehngenii TaxID=2223 RepID=UPI002A370002|nr:hypothetical protein [Methanothrix soehngenii]MDY0413171.1 hypothetical protein [Methanothrix soehngenii]